MSGCSLRTRDNNATIDYIRAKGFTVLDCNADEILDEKMLEELREREKDRWNRKGRKSLMAS